MTSTQAFIWFCKEQGVVGEIIKMFYETRPRTHTPEGVKYINFKRYYDDIVELYGFGYSLERIFELYISTLRKTMPYSLAYEKKNELFKKYANLIKKWRYFVKNNLKINPNTFKIGDTVSYNRWNNGKILVEKIDLDRYEITGLNTYSNRRDYMHISYLRDLNGEKLKTDYIIKRKRKIYHGVNTK